MPDFDADVIIIGAGPAGCLAACLIRQQGFSVRILEKNTFPRFVIGESLLPQVMNLLESAGMLDAVRKHGFQLKNGAVFHRAGQVTTFDFHDKFSPGPSDTFQVQRADFEPTWNDYSG